MVFFGCFLAFPATHSRVVIQLAEYRKPSQMPTREYSAPISAWSCRHCHQHCAPASLATLVKMSPPPGQAWTVDNALGMLKKTRRTTAPPFPSSLPLHESDAEPAQAPLCPPARFSHDSDSENLSRSNRATSCAVSTLTDSLRRWGG